MPALASWPLDQVQPAWPAAPPMPWAAPGSRCRRLPLARQCVPALRHLARRQCGGSGSRVQRCGRPPQRRRQLRLRLQQLRLLPTLCWRTSLCCASAGAALRLLWPLREHRPTFTVYRSGELFQSWCLLSWCPPLCFAGMLTHLLLYQSTLSSAAPSFAFLLQFNRRRGAMALAIIPLHLSQTQWICPLSMDRAKSKSPRAAVCQKHKGQAPEAQRMH